MKILPINNYANISFSHQDDYIVQQTKQIMRENLKSITDEAYETASKRIRDEYMPKFENIIHKKNTTISNSDINCILSELQNVYDEAGLSNEASAIGKHLKKLA